MRLQLSADIASILGLCFSLLNSVSHFIDPSYIFRFLVPLIAAYGLFRLKKHYAPRGKRPFNVSIVILALFFVLCLFGFPWNLNLWSYPDTGLTRLKWNWLKPLYSFVKKRRIQSDSRPLVFSGFEWSAECDQWCKQQHFGNPSRGVYFELLRSTPPPWKESTVFFTVKSLYTEDWQLTTDVVYNLDKNRKLLSPGFPYRSSEKITRDKIQLYSSDTGIRAVVCGTCLKDIDKTKVPFNQALDLVDIQVSFPH